MNRRVRRLLVGWVIAAYGAMSLCGPALHALPGMGHAKAFDRGDNSTQLATSHDDCPVCHFLAQGQIGADSDHDLWTDVVRVRPDDDLPLFSLPAPDGPSSPRAPPLA